MATINGTAGNDVIAGTTADDIIDGGLGNDRINGGAGNDVLAGNDGNDTLTGDAGNDTLYGGAGNDGFFGGGNDDTIYGEAGDDNMFGDAGNDTLYGGDGNDSMTGGTGDDTFYGGAGVNTITGGGGVDTFVIELSSDTVTQEMRDDLWVLKSWMDDKASTAGSLANQAAQTTGSALTLSALGLTISTIEAVKIILDGIETPIDDFLNAAPDMETSVALTVNEDSAVSGEVGATDANGDTLEYSLTEGPANGTLTLDESTGAYTYQAAANFSGSDAFSFVVFDGIGGVSYQDVTVEVAAVADAASLSVADQTIALTAGVLKGTRVNDTLTAGSGTSYIVGGGGNDTISATTQVVTTTLDISGALADIDGSETLSYRIAGIPTGGSLSAGVANPDGTWSLSAAEAAGVSLTASSAADIALTVTALSTEANGDTASTAQTLNISFDRAAAPSVIEGGSGSDIVNGSASSDVIYGGSAPKNTNSLPNVSHENDNDTLNGGDGNDTIYGQRGDDVVTGDAGHDTLSGGKGNDVVTGGEGNDIISGNSGNDTISDGAGDDTVSGNSGDDVLIAGEGNDSYNGGSGIDTLDFADATAGVTVDISKKTASGMGDDTFSAVEKFLGSAFNDSFKGSSSADTIDGGAGDDWIRGLSGADALTGGEGRDTFFWEKTDVGSGNGVDHITDFSVGDVLDFRKLASVGSKPLGDFVKVVDTSAGSIVSVKVGSAYVAVATLDDVHGKTASDMLADGQLLVG